MNFTPLQKKLLPHIGDFKSYELAVALFPLKEAYATKYLALHPRFQRRLSKQVLAEYDVDLDLSAKPFEKEHILQAILEMPIQAVIKNIGLAWNADRVAASAFKDQAQTNNVLSEFSVSEVRNALQFRSAEKNTSPRLQDQKTVIKDGAICFAAWIDDIPNDQRKMIEYACDTSKIMLPDITALPHHDKEIRSEFCANWCAIRMTMNTQKEQEAPKTAEGEQ